ncbi:hypothetical protein JYT28_00305 [Desulfobulbus sp. AH-315-M07]|nr:hypothetical protein [Desulfobulbus sp. AH-315-M07]
MVRAITCALCLLAVAACSVAIDFPVGQGAGGAGAAGSAGGAGPASSVPSSSSSGGPSGEIRPMTFWVRGAFGYDPTLDRALPYFLDEFDTLPIRPWMELLVEQEDADGNALDPCIVSLSTSQEAIPAATWVAEASTGGVVIRFGYELPIDGPSDNCFGWDPSWADAADAAANFTWGLGVGDLRAELASGGSDELEATIVAESGQSEWDDNWAPFVVGGAVHWSGLADAPGSPGAVSTFAYAFGQQVDEAFITLHAPAMNGREGEPLKIPAAEILGGQQLPRGVYIVNIAVPFAAAPLFAAQ